MRDFTYIDDVIDGLVSLTEVLLEQHNSVECGVVYNLGYGSPVAVDTMISYLEEELDKKAIVVGVMYFVDWTHGLAPLSSYNCSYCSSL